MAHGVRETRPTWQVETTFFCLHVQVVERRIPALRSQRHAMEDWSSSSGVTEGIVCPGSHMLILPDWDTIRKGHGEVSANALYSLTKQLALGQGPPSMGCNLFTCHPDTDWLSPLGCHWRFLGSAVKAADHSAEFHKPVNTQTQHCKDQLIKEIGISVRPFYCLPKEGVKHLFFFKTIWISVTLIHSPSCCTLRYAAKQVGPLYGQPQCEAKEWGRRICLHWDTLVNFAEHLNDSNYFLMLFL